MNRITNDSDISICLTELLHLLNVGAGSFRCKIYVQEDKKSLIYKTDLTPKRLRKSVEALATYTTKNNKLVEDTSSNLSSIKNSITYSRVQYTRTVLFTADLPKLEQALLKLIYQHVPEFYVKPGVTSLFTQIPKEDDTPKTIHISKEGKITGDIELFKEELGLKVSEEKPEVEKKDIDDLLNFNIAEMMEYVRLGHVTLDPQENRYSLTYEYLVKRHCSENNPVDFFHADLVWSQGVANIGKLTYRPDFNSEDKDDKRRRIELDERCLKLWSKLSKEGIPIKQYFRAYSMYCGDLLKKDRTLSPSIYHAIAPNVMEAVLSRF